MQSEILAGRINAMIDGTILAIEIIAGFTFLVHLLSSSEQKNKKKSETCPSYDAWRDSLPDVKKTTKEPIIYEIGPLPYDLRTP